MYIYEEPEWPNFEWDSNKLMPLLAYVRNKQGVLIGKMGNLGFDLKNRSNLEILLQEIIKSSEIEGVTLNKDQVRSSIAKRLGLEISGLVQTDRKVDGAVDLMIDATKNYNHELTKERLFAWHSSLFPEGFSGIYKIIVGNWRDDSSGPMQVVSGVIGKEKIHFQAPKAGKIDSEIQLFLDWFNFENNLDLVLKAAIAHLWFITIHPFDDGNGRISRAISEMLLARSDDQSYRFYSMSSQIRKERAAYYNILEITQRGKLNITGWIDWYLKCLLKSIENSEILLKAVIDKHNFWMNNSKVDLNDRQRKILNLMIDEFEGNLTSAKWSKLTKCSPDTALRDIKNLIELDILEKSKSGGRSTHYVLKKI